MGHVIFGVHITSRVDDVPSVQAVLSKYGCNIKTRLGIHDADSTSCLVTSSANYRRSFQ